jgi:hypothetical protein
MMNNGDAQTENDGQSTQKNPRFPAGDETEPNFPIGKTAMKQNAELQMNEDLLSKSASSLTKAEIAERRRLIAEAMERQDKYVAKPGDDLDYDNL